MKWLQIDNEVYDLEKLVSYRIMVHFERTADYVERYDPEGDVIERHPGPTRQVLTVQLFFTHGDGPVLDEADSKLFLEFAKKHWSVEELRPETAG